MSISRIKKNDMVVAISGSNAGKTGKVLQVVSARGAAIVEGLNFRKKTIRKNQDNPTGAIVEKEAPIKLSNLMPYCQGCKKGVKVRRDRAGGELTRKCASCGHAL